jgi:hypothetical protein
MLFLGRRGLIAGTRNFISTVRDRSVEPLVAYSRLCHCCSDIARLAAILRQQSYKIRRAHFAPHFHAHSRQLTRYAAASSKSYAVHLQSHTKSSPPGGISLPACISNTWQHTIQGNSQHVDPSALPRPAVRYHIHDS